MSTNRLRQARELAGMSPNEVERYRGIGQQVLDDMESGRLPMEDDVVAELADLYRMPVAYLQGTEAHVPDELRKQLDEANVSPADRDTVLEFAEMLSLFLSQPSANERLASMARHTATPEQVIAGERSLRAKVGYVKRQRQTRDHECHWPGCTKQVPPAMWGCIGHWRKLPKALRDRIWAAYRPGQEATMTPSAEYLQVADDVQQWIREHGGTP